MRVYWELMQPRRMGIRRRCKRLILRTNANARGHHFCGSLLQTICVRVGSDGRAQ